MTLAIIKFDYFGFTVCDCGDALCRMEERMEEKEEKSLDDDPAIEFQLNSDAHIHACLGLIGAAGLPASVPPLAAGAGAAASRANLIKWLDGLIERHCKSARRVRDANEDVVEGSYDHIMGHEYSTVISKLTNLTAWTANIFAANESLGIVKVNHGGGVVKSTTIYSKFGPFNGVLY